MELIRNRRGTEYAVNEAGEITHKRCTGCGEVKPATGFYKSKRHVGGIKNHCNVCTGAYTHKWYMENSELMKAYQKYCRLKKKKGKFKNG